MMIIVSGGSGYIGRHVLNNVEYSEGISLRSAGWKHKVADCNVIINLIGKAHDHKGVAIESDYYYANVVLLKELFTEFINSSASLFIHISSIAAVEEYESVDYLVEDALCNPISYYGKSKREAEEWLLFQDIPNDKKLIILRPPMIHGFGDKGNLGLLYKLISKGIPYPLSSFENKRSFISIDNFCFIIQEIIKGRELLDTGVYHIADDESVSTKEVIVVIKEVTGKDVPDIAVPRLMLQAVAKLGDILPLPLNTKRLKKMTSTLLVSNEKLKTALGIERLPLTAKEGLEKTIRSFKSSNF